MDDRPSVTEASLRGAPPKKGEKRKRAAARKGGKRRRVAPPTAAGGNGPQPKFVAVGERAWVDPNAVTWVRVTTEGFTPRHSLEIGVAGARKPLFFDFGSRYPRKELLALEVAKRTRDDDPLPSGDESSDGE